MLRLAARIAPRIAASVAVPLQGSAQALSRPATMQNFTRIAVQNITKRTLAGGKDVSGERRGVGGVGWGGVGWVVVRGRRAGVRARAQCVLDREGWSSGSALITRLNDPGKLQFQSYPPPALLFISSFLVSSESVPLMIGQYASRYGTRVRVEATRGSLGALTRDK